MTYLQFHFVFILPAILVLGIVYGRRRRLHPGRRSPLRWIFAMCVIALVYTTPWDNYLVANDVWWYGPDRVIGTIGFVPIEEYAFFVLQPILTGLWFALLPRIKLSVRPPNNMIRAVGALTALALAGLGAWMLTNESTFYMGLIVAWALPIVAGQWAWYGDVFVHHLPRLALAIGVPTVYLWIADAIAIWQGIWVISPDYTVGINPFGLPIEEATFFLVTNVMVILGLTMFTEDRAALMSDQSSSEMGKMSTPVR
jgi:lycopene beta-cyclase